MPKQRVARALQIATDVLFALCFGAVLARLLLYGAEYISDMPAEVNNWLALCVALVWLCILLLAAHGMQRFANTAIGRFFASARGAFFAFALLLSVQLTIALCCYCPSGWDPQVLLTTANEMLLGTPYTGTYFHQNPNNLFLLGCYRYFFALLNRFGLTDYMPWAVGAGVCLVNLSCLFLFLLARRLFGMRAAWLSFLLCAPAVALSPWISVPYSDTYGIPFAIGSVYFYVIAREELRSVRSGLYGVLCGAWLALGTRIKPTVLLLVIAAAGMELLCRAGHRHDAEDASATPKQDRHALLRTVACFLLGAVLAAAGGSAFQRHVADGFLDPERAEREAFSATHYLMMGLSQPHGSYAYEDMQFTEAVKGRAAKTDANLTEAARRIHALGPRGYASFLWRKLNFSWDDGTFFFGREGAFYWGEAPQTSRFASAVQSVFRADGTHYKLLALWQQAQWLLLILLMLCGTLYRNAPHAKWVWQARICTLGLVCFLLVFEARSRYIYHFLPVLYLAALGGLLVLTKFLGVRKAAAKSRKETSHADFCPSGDFSPRK